MISCLIALKFNEDIIFNNLEFAKIGGIEVTELNQMEIAFLNMIDFNLIVSKTCFSEYLEIIVNEKEKEKIKEEKRLIKKQNKYRTSKTLVKSKAALEKMMSRKNQTYAKIN